MVLLLGCTEHQQDAAYGELMDHGVEIQAPAEVNVGAIIFARIVDKCPEGAHAGCDTQTYTVVSASASGALYMPMLRGGDSVEVWAEHAGGGSVSITAMVDGSMLQASATKSINVASGPPPIDAPGNMTPIDTCSNAQPITAGTYDGDTTPYYDDATPPGDCTNGFSAFGPDAFYRVELTAGQQLVATVTPSGWDASLYVLSSCTLSSCTAGVDAAGSSGPETTTFTAPSTDTYHVVVDSSSQTQRGPFTLQVTIQ